ncbi:hypothetical protein ANANG_G00141070 [Anguilla anguilla]|uniref:Uncharacterized protein n=1 Tax=Anguilla anguilla TaxID=7936 RepID=A0A9D3RXZ9_ANGAN|nr:hypothetical protein ANANG_G00141070 [Anguilla anguilla]
MPWFGRAPRLLYGRGSAAERQRDSAAARARESAWRQLCEGGSPRDYLSEGTGCRSSSPLLCSALLISPLLRAPPEPVRGCGASLVRHPPPPILILLHLLSPGSSGSAFVPARGREAVCHRRAARGFLGFLLVLILCPSAAAVVLSRSRAPPRSRSLFSAALPPAPVASHDALFHAPLLGGSSMDRALAGTPTTDWFGTLRTGMLSIPAVNGRGR